MQPWWKADRGLTSGKTNGIKWVECIPSSPKEKNPISSVALFWSHPFSLPPFFTATPIYGKLRPSSDRFPICISSWQSHWVLFFSHSHLSLFVLINTIHGKLRLPSHDRFPIWLSSWSEISPTLAQRDCSDKLVLLLTQFWIPKDLFTSAASVRTLCSVLSDGLMMWSSKSSH